jgi:hypothetical protein
LFANFDFVGFIRSKKFYLNFPLRYNAKMVGCQPNLFFSDENISIRGGELERFMPVYGRMSTPLRNAKGARHRHWV